MFDGYGIYWKSYRETVKKKQPIPTNLMSCSKQPSQISSIHMTDLKKNTYMLPISKIQAPH